jgi:hypothetical protein
MTDGLLRAVFGLLHVDGIVLHMCIVLRGMSAAARRRQTGISRGNYLACAQEVNRVT